MSGRPYTYGRAMAIAQLMRDRRRPAVREAETKKRLRHIYLHGEDLFVAYQDTIDWVPKLTKLTRYGREECFIVEGKPEIEGQPYIQWGTQVIEPIAAWPSEDEIAAEIAASVEREKNWNGSLSANDLSAMIRLVGS